MSVTAFDSFMNCPELVDLVAQKCSWYTLVSLYEVDTCFRQIVQSLVRTRCLNLLSNFFDWDSVAGFFDLLQLTGAAIVGSLVRCIISADTFDFYREVNPRQLNISVPYTPECTSSSSGSLSYRRWFRFLSGNGYQDVHGMGIGEAPVHMHATSNEWTVFNHKTFNGRRVSLIQSRTCSALSPVLQCCHTSNFFALTSTRIYCLYPKLFAQKATLNLRDHIPAFECAFDSFNIGLVSFVSTDFWDLFPSGTCGEACPSVWRRTRGLPGVGIFRWGGFLGLYDHGLVVSDSDKFELRDEIWKPRGECANETCPFITLFTNLFETAVVGL